MSNRIHRTAARLALIIAVVFLRALSPAAAAEPKTLNWDNLIPQLPDLESPFLELPEDIQIDVEILADIRWMEANGGVTKGGPADQERQDLLRSLTKEGVDIDAAVQDYENLRLEIEKRNGKVVSDLSGATVRMPGYALPLEFEGEAVREFLLVPYVGACIHTPPPPANQMVFVKVNQPFVIKDLFEAVWVTGRLDTKTTTKQLSFVDGETAIEAGYVMEGNRIERLESETWR